MASRAEANVVYAVGVVQGIALVTLPAASFCGALIGDGTNPTGLYIGYVVGGGIMILGGIVELLIGIKAEGKSLETVTTPLTATNQQAATPEPAV